MKKKAELGSNLNKSDQVRLTTSPCRTSGFKAGKLFCQQNDKHVFSSIELKKSFFEHS